MAQVFEKKRILKNCIIGINCGDRMNSFVFKTFKTVQNLVLGHHYFNCELTQPTLTSNILDNYLQILFCNFWRV